MKLTTGILIMVVCGLAAHALQHFCHWLANSF